MKKTHCFKIHYLLFLIILFAVFCSSCMPQPAGKDLGERLGPILDVLDYMENSGKYEFIDAAAYLKNSDIRVEMKSSQYSRPFGSTIGITNCVSGKLKKLRISLVINDFYFYDFEYFEKAILIYNEVENIKCFKTKFNEVNKDNSLDTCEERNTQLNKLCKREDAKRHIKCRDLYLEFYDPDKPHSKFGENIMQLFETCETGTDTATEITESDLVDCLYEEIY
ncbi:hypothetical protein JXB41_02325 [Candidatus Woesearchaeota archaeon]|nr:hypothetical protein [Candidatus Woesearchaeota archaeon]